MSKPSEKNTETEKATNTANEQNQSEPNATKTEKTKRVRVICEGVLGPLGLVKGDETDDADYVALLKTKRGKTLVQEIK